EARMDEDRSRSASRRTGVNDMLMRQGMVDCQQRAGMENELSRVVDALPGLVRTRLPDGHIDFLNQRLCTYAGLSLDGARGMGIGLSVSRSSIEWHQGRLWAAPNAGPGATCAYSLPCGPAGGRR